MEPDFWHQRWQENRIGFHKDEVNPRLIECWPRLGVAPPARVFVPLCGKSLDLVWLLEQGYQVEGVELSELAVQAFFDEQKLPYKHVELGEWRVWEGENIRLWCGDFFQLTTAQIGALEAVYDRAALIALPAPMRQRYVRHLLQLTGGCPQLLITLAYPQEEMDGPPFSVEAAEVRQLYASVYAGADQPCLQADVLAQNPHLQARGLARLDETVFILSPQKTSASSHI